MKKIVASVGLVALGASGLQAAGASGITAEVSKPWSISATLRGFYDDNINSAPNDLNLGSYKRDSFGFEVSPSVSLILPMEQGSLTANYTYGYKYYDNPLLNTTSHDVQTHVFNLGFDHAFSERYQVSLKDSFVIGQEPDVLRAGNAMETFQTISGDNMRNAGAINFDGAITRELGYQIGYGNNWYDYANDGPTVDPVTGGVTASTAGLLNRIENIPHIDLRWQIQPQTVGVLGYQFRGVNYNSGEVIAGSIVPPTPYVQSDIRNSMSHYGYVGMDHTFRPDLTGSFRVGVNYSDYYNDPTTQSQVSPYILANLRYTYAVESFFELGLTTDRNATDVLGSSADGYTMDQQSTVVYASVTHAITPKLFGTIIGQYQYSTFNGGQYNNQAENFYSAGVNLEYRFNRYFGAHVGYNFDALDSDLGGIRNFDRNRVFIGVSARY
jgi:hypothetical protein